MRIDFDVKYGKNSIDIPINGGKVYADNAPDGLSNLNDGTFTIINQIPTSQSVGTKAAWHKFRLTGCGKKDGLYDKSTGGMSFKADTWTAYIFDWQSYKPPVWTSGGFYVLPDMTNYFTATMGDLIIFDDIADAVPTSVSEFNALREKYKNAGGIITGVEIYIKYRPDGTPWNTNHIELIKG